MTEVSEGSKLTLYNLREQSIARVREVAEKLNTLAAQAEQVYATEQPIIDSTSEILGDWQPQSQPEV